MNTPDLPSLSPYMCMVLYLFFDGEKPYDIYSNIAEDASHEEDQTFDAEVKKLRAYFEQRMREDK